MTTTFGAAARAVTTSKGLINDPLVSEKHARVVYSGDSFWIEDLGSRNGTFVNGRRIDRRSVLRDGYLIRVGSSMIRFGQDRDENNSAR